MVYIGDSDLATWVTNIMKGLFRWALRGNVWAADASIFNEFIRLPYHFHSTLGAKINGLSVCTFDYRRYFMLRDSENVQLNRGALRITNNRYLRLGTS